MRFSLRSLMIVIAAIAFLGAVCFAVPVWIANMIMAPLPLIVRGVLAVALIYGRKRTQPFYIGALTPFVMTVLSWSSEYSQAPFHYLGVMRRLYAAIGQPRELMVDEALYETFVFTSPFAYFQITFLLLCSLVAGFLGLAVAWLVRDERGES